MIIARLSDGRLIMHNPIALDEPSMAKIEAWGEVSAILIPNRFHRRDAFIMHARYPNAKVYAPSGAVAQASKATPCSGTYAEVPTDATVLLRDIEGIGRREGVVIVRSDDGISAVFCDTLLNLPKLSGPMGMILHPTGTLAVPRPTRWLFTQDIAALRRDLLSIATTEGLVRVLPGHGSVVASDTAQRLQVAAERL
jgi:hypothetical protein